MKLAEALKIASVPPTAGAQQFRVGLVCGFEPLHFATLLKAHLKQRMPEYSTAVDNGFFGDLVGNLERLDPASCHAVVLLVEWADLDARLGVRQLGIWNVAAEAEIVNNADATLRRLEKALGRVVAQTRILCCMPTLPLPPFAHTPSWHASDPELHLRRSIAEFALTVSRKEGIQVLNAMEIDRHSLLGSRRDLKSEILSGFPYQIPHADILAEWTALALAPPVAKKGLITDLDDTLWSGLLGEDGVHNVHWDLDHSSQVHGLYQQLLRSLAESGVLIGVASKSDPLLAHQVLTRPDILIGAQQIFPIEVNWGRKSESIRRILRAWNIGADAVVFIDDSAMELAEVKVAFPQMECLLFASSDVASVYQLICKLRGMFGKLSLSEEDNIRAQSLRNAWNRRGSVEEGIAPTTDEFLQTAEATVTINRRKQSVDQRALELVNKTNQFNLNGCRFEETEWNRYLARPETIYILVSYADKFGPLGKIAVLCGQKQEGHLVVEIWVMSCRAFSRRIEHACLKYLFDRFDVPEVHFRFRSTDRNGPTRELFEYYLNSVEGPLLTLSRERFEEKEPRLFCHLEETNDG